MTYVMYMSTDNDITNTQLNVAWNPITARYNWAQVSGGGNNIPNGATIVVIAHGNDGEIGNARAGVVDINATTFLVCIQNNMAHHAAPAAIYLSTCGSGIAGFTAAVRIAAEQNAIWRNVHLYGHSDSQGGAVQPPNSIVWTPIF
jgi:hypothetical protein